MTKEKNMSRTTSNRINTGTVGIIGAGAIGQAMAKRLVAAGVDVILSNSRTKPRVPTSCL
jgi:phosphoglycerate dehydrogenase-like enzyme